MKKCEAFFLTVEQYAEKLKESRQKYVDSLTFLDYYSRNCDDDPKKQEKSVDNLENLIKLFDLTLIKVRLCVQLLKIDGANTKLEVQKTLIDLIDALEGVGHERN
jgi:hypothetical protein